MKDSNRERNRQAVLLLFEQALSFEKNGNQKLALEKYKMALQIDQQFFDAWLNAGAIYTRQGKSDKAIVCYQRALVSRDDIRAHYNLAAEYFKTGNYVAAEKCLYTVLKMDRRYLQAHLLLGYVFGKTGKNDKAELSIKNVLKIEPENYQAQTALALLYYHTHRKDLAARLIQAQLAKKPDDRVLQKLFATLSMEKEDLKSATRALKSVVDRDPVLKSFYVSLRETLKPEKKKVISAQRKAIQQKKSPSRKELMDLSLLQFFDGDPKEAMETLEKLAQSVEKFKK